MGPDSSATVGVNLNGDLVIEFLGKETNNELIGVLKLSGNANATVNMNGSDAGIGSLGGGGSGNITIEGALMIADSDSNKAIRVHFSATFNMPSDLDYSENMTPAQKTALLKQVIPSAYLKIYGSSNTPLADLNRDEIIEMITED